MALVEREGPPERAAGQQIRDPRDAARFFASIARLPLEVAAFAYFDPEWRLLGVRHCLSNAPDMIALSSRDVARDALAFDARLVLMAHNHPSGDPQPSNEDLVTTRALARLLDALDVQLVDHLVLTRDGCTSLRAERLL